ncbi:MAG: GMC family oxidoreductase, partial [Thermomicrobiales bacterium]
AEAGCDGWSGAEVLPALIRLEDDVDFGDAPYHGRGGPIPVHRAPLEKWGAVDKALRTAALDEGYGWADDCNAPGSTGVSPFPIDSRDGERVSTNDGYLEPARGRANLTIRGDVTVDRVCMQDQTATGLHGLGPNGWEEFHAREVIVACGTVHSPGMLIRSGIGPEAMVRAIGVQPIADLPVGRNFIDHSSIWIGIDLKPGARWTDVRDRHTNCCVRYSSGMAGAGRNDLFMASMNVAGWDEEGLRKGVVVAATYQTFSRGELRVVSRDARVDPEIDINMLSDERDLVRLREGYKRIHRILRHPAFTAIAERIRGRVTGEDLGEMPDDDAIDRLLLAEAEDTQHPVGSCRMGRPDDPRSVVDPDCRVIGVEGLRVIDASVMPEHVRANTHLTTVMIAEHMAARMRAD